MINKIDIEQKEIVHKMTFYIAEKPEIMDLVLFTQHLNMPLANISAVNTVGDGLLHVTTKTSKVSFILELINHNISLDSRNADGNTALHLAAQMNNREIVTILLKAKADSFIENNDGKLALELTSDIVIQSTLLWMLNALFLKSVDVNSYAGVMYCLFKGANINFQNNEGNNALHIALFRNYKDISRFLLEKGIEKDRYNNALMAPIHVASGRKHLDLLVLLVETGESLDLDVVDNHGVTALHHAIIGRDQISRDTVMYLLNKGANPFITSPVDFSLLYKAAFLGFNNIIEKILALNSSVINEQNNNFNYSALHASVLGKELSSLELLVHEGADITVVSKDKQTAYGIAEALNYKEAIDYLGLKCIKFISAVANNRFDLVTRALSSSKVINCKEKLGYNALHLAVIHDHFEMAEFLLKEKIKISADNFKNTPLHYAAEANNCAMMSLLMSYGANPHQLNLEELSAFNLTTSCAFHTIDLGNNINFYVLIEQ